VAAFRFNSMMMRSSGLPGRAEPFACGFTASWQNQTRVRIRSSLLALPFSNDSIPRDLMILCVAAGPDKHAPDRIGRCQWRHWRRQPSLPVRRDGLLALLAPMAPMP
jgi:hypothetical protein